jgi:isoleucyl-tRNA synthetase
MTSQDPLSFSALPADRPAAESEAEVRAFWKDAEVFKKSLARNPDGEPYVFYEGPPTANGMPHHGHVLTRAIKDLFPRYQTMLGRRVERKAGWDTHGLPVEIEVEKTLGLDGKQDVERYGIEPFIAQCKESVWKYKGEWETLTDRIGFWLDMEHPYVTYSTDYVESVWWALQQIHAKGLLYKAYKILNWCPRDMTALSKGEVGDGQKEVEDPAITVAFPLKGEEEVYALAWTTTPWTLLSNICLVVGPDLDYVYARSKGHTYVLAEARLKAVLGKDAEVLKTVKGSELIGREYTPPFDFYGELEGPAHKVVGGAFVTTGDGTGIVHAAPAFGEDDYAVCRENGLAFVNLVKPDGTFTEACGDYAGQWVKDADKAIIKELKGRGLLLKSERYKHNYPHCWRCKTPLLYYARDAWFIKTTEVKDRLEGINQQIKWFPEHIRDGRFGDFLANNRDWALSRERYWGTPLPVWECQAEECGGQVVVGSVAELRELNPDVPADLDPHRPGIDEVQVPCSKCGGPAKRVVEVIDCWFDSGAMPFAQWGYPHVEGSKERFEQNHPANFISEAIDQTRGWFYTLHAISTLLWDAPTYQRCLVLGHVQDEKGKKLSKRDKNYRSPNEVLDAHGADAFRWFFYANMTPGEGVRFSDNAIKDARKSLLKLLNVYKFFQEYASSDGFDPRPGGTARPEPKDREALDRWILSYLQTTVGEVRGGLDAYDYHKAANAIEAFLEGLSNWYVRRSRDRGWSKASPENTAKWAFWWTLYESLTTLARLLAPFTPFLAEDLHRVLEREVLADTTESVHLCDYPAADEALLDLDLEAQMSLARRAVNLGLQVRNANKLKVRQGLSRAVLLLSTPAEEEAVKGLAEVIADELNVKTVEVSREHDTYVEFDVRVDFRKLGPRFGKRLGAVRKALGGLDARELAAKARAGEAVELDVDGTAEHITPDELDVRLSARDGFAAARELSLVVVLDTQLTPELVREGLAREVQSRIQGRRKELDLPFAARIEVWLDLPDGELREAAEAHREAIAGEVQADAIHLGEAPDGVESTTVKLAGGEVPLALRVVA